MGASEYLKRWEWMSVSVFEYAQSFTQTRRPDEDVPDGFAGAEGGAADATAGAGADCEGVGTGDELATLGTGWGLSSLATGVESRSRAGVRRAKNSSAR